MFLYVIGHLIYYQEYEEFTVAKAEEEEEENEENKESKKKRNLYSLTLTSLDRIRYLTRRPLSTASVWLSKSGGLIPETDFKYKKERLRKCNKSFSLQPKEISPSNNENHIKLRAFPVLSKEIKQHKKNNNKDDLKNA